MLKSLKKPSYRFVVVLLLLITLLAFDVGRVTKVEAVATTAAIAGAALVGTGAIYLGYLALTGAEVSIPSGTGAEIQDYLKTVGQKVAYYTSGAAIYNKLYSFLRGNGVSALNNYDVTLTQDSLKDIYNDFKDIALNQDITSYYVPYEYLQATNQFPYTDRLYIPDPIFDNGSTLVERDYVLFSGSPVIYTINSINDDFIVLNSAPNTYRNILLTSGYYGVQQLINGTWTLISTIPCGALSLNGDYYTFPYGNDFRYYYPGINSPATANSSNYSTYPLFPTEPIFVESTGEIIDTVEVAEGEYVTTPNYSNNNDDDGRQYPVVPYVQLPDGGNWGFNLGDLITEIINRAAQTITAVGIGDLINRFMNSLGSSTGDYIYYSDNDNNYYIYYNDTYIGDSYTTYNINISDQEDIIPVDLNTIQQYTNNQYLTVIKERAESFGETFGELVAFWHNCDPEIIYAFLGASIIVLLGAFIGKWGHS